MHDTVDFVREQVQKHEVYALPQNLTEPVEVLDRKSENRELEQEGLRLFRENKVAVLMAAGGLSTRLGIKEHRGNLPIGPITNRTIFQLQAEKIAAVRERYAPQLLWLILTSPESHEAVESSFVSADYFGFPANSIFLLQQKSFPVLDSDNNPVLLPNGQYLLAPGGHGGAYEALNTSGLLKRLIAEGIEHLLFFQYPNVLEVVFDPRMIAYHAVNGFGVTVKAFMTGMSDEQLGRCAIVNGGVQVVEYYYQQLNPMSLPWHRFPASAGTYLWSIAFLEDCISARVTLPFHVLPHKRAPDSPARMTKIEQFIFDLIPYSPHNGIILVAREEEYATVKTREGINSLEACRAALARVYYRWMIDSGAIPCGEAKDCTVEISPRFALNQSELQAKIPRGLLLRPGMIFS